MEWITFAIFAFLTLILLVAGIGAAFGWWWSSTPPTDNQVELHKYYGLDGTENTT